jgi:iron uptake system component EfeO
VPDLGRASILPLLAVATLALVGCASAGVATSSAGSTPTVGGDRTISITLTDAGCPAQPSAIVAGPVTFRVTNQGANAVSEVEITQGGRILGEKENLAPGLSGSFSLDLAPGEYGVDCPGATTESTQLTVIGGASASPTSAAGGPSDDAGAAKLAAALGDAVVGYEAYVRATVAGLVVATDSFTAAVTGGDVERAKALYPAARILYERIEPVAESFGDLDPAIDIRIAGVTDPATWTGFHRLEKALWVDRSTAGMAPIAHKLVDDVGRLRTLVDTATYQPAQLANGASELLDEVASSKITGEEEAYSRIDLVDFAANIDGARAAFRLLEPALQLVDPALATTIDGRFAAVEAALQAYRDGAGYMTYDKLTPADVRALSAVVGALAEPLSQVAARVIGGS